MTPPFRVALSGDFLDAGGNMAYPMVDLSPFEAAGIEYEYVPVIDGEVPASSLEGFDALILLSAKFTVASVPPGTVSPSSNRPATTLLLSRL